MPIIGFLPPAVSVPLRERPADDAQSVAARSTCPKRVSKSLGRSSELTKDQVGQKVIGDPEDGCRSLLVRLSADLERAGTILPQQLKIVLSGLGTLPGRILTVAAYERIGATAGLEARLIEDRIAPRP